MTGGGAERSGAAQPGYAEDADAAAGMTVNWPGWAAAIVRSLGETK